MVRTGKGIVPAWVALVLAMGAGCSKPLPEEGTLSAKIYRERCGTCHRPVQPSTMKAAAWEMILPRMESRIQASGNPLRPEERAIIESYVKRNSG